MAWVGFCERTNYFIIRLLKSPFCFCFFIYFLLLLLSFPDFQIALYIALRHILQFTFCRTNSEGMMFCHLALLDVLTNVNILLIYLKMSGAKQTLFRYSNGKQFHINSHVL